MVENSRESNIVDGQLQMVGGGGRRCSYCQDVNADDDEYDFSLMWIVDNKA